MVLSIEDSAQPAGGSAFQPCSELNCVGRANLKNWIMAMKPYTPAAIIHNCRSLLR